MTVVHSCITRCVRYMCVNFLLLIIIKFCPVKKIILAVNPAYWLFTMLLFFCMSTEISAQQKATIDENYILTLDTSVPLSNAYEAVMSIPSFNEEKFVTLLEMLSDQHIELELKPEESKVLIEMLSPTFYGKSMSVEDWNNLLNVRIERLRLAIGL